jgi:hypothetical protein
VRKFLDTNGRARDEIDKIFTIVQFIFRCVRFDSRNEEGGQKFCETGNVGGKCRRRRHFYAKTRVLASRSTEQTKKLQKIYRSEGGALGFNGTSCLSRMV